MAGNQAASTFGAGQQNWQAGPNQQQWPTGNQAATAAGGGGAGWQTEQQHSQTAGAVGGGGGGGATKPSETYQRTFDYVQQCQNWTSQ